MAITGDTRPDDQWADDETEPMHDDSLFVDFDDNDELPEVREEIQRRVPNWRVIENIREERNLKWAMADFEDYDFDNFVEQ